MRWLREIAFRLQPVFRKRKIEAELSDELRIHLEMATEANLAAGMSPEQARTAAEREFGGLEIIKQNYRDERGISWIEHLIQDLTFGTRMLRKSPTFTIVVVATLAVGIAANTALFSALNALLLRPLPVREPGRLVGLYRKGPAERSYNRISYPDFEALRDRSQSFTGLAAYNFTPVHFSAAGATSRIWGQLVTENYFSVLGVNLAAGHGFSASRETLTPKPEVVLSHTCWKTRFNSDPAIVGNTVTLNGLAFTVVAIAPETFRDLEAWLAPEVWMPISMQPQIVPGNNWLRAEGYSWLRVVGRLAPHVTVGAAQVEASALAAQIRAERGPNAALSGVAVVPDVGLNPELRPIVRGLLLTLMAVAGIVSLMVGVNLTTLWLARSMTRWKEMGTRLALGATRGRLFRQMLTESAMLAAIGGALAVSLVPWLMRGIEWLQAVSSVPAPVHFGWDHRVFLFSGAVAVLAGLVFGSVPAWCAAKTDILSVMKHGSPHERLKPSTWKHTFITVQIAASFVLLVCAALFLRSFQRHQRIDLGFNTDALLVASFDVGLQGYAPERGRTFHDEVKRAARSVPGVEAASIGHFLPLSPWSEDMSIWLDGDGRRAGDGRVVVNFNMVDADYFSTMGLPLLHGRSFTPGDTAASAPTVIVNETLARLMAPEGEVLNRRLRLEPGGPAHRIVGVARDSKYVTLNEPPRPFVYFPLAQHYRSSATLIVRTAVRPDALLPEVLRAVQAVDKDLPVYRGSTMIEHVQAQLFVPKWSATLIGIFAGLALLLALLGIFGVTAYDVTQRTREIAVRVALGAPHGAIVWLMVKSRLKLIAAGVLAGLVLTFVAGRFLKTLLHGLSPLDAISVGLAAATLSATALLACYLPARRAAAIAPTDALRQE